MGVWEVTSRRNVVCLALCLPVSPFYAIAPWCSVSSPIPALSLVGLGEMAHRPQCQLPASCSSAGHVTWAWPGRAVDWLWGHLLELSGKGRSLFAGIVEFVECKLGNCHLVCSLRRNATQTKAEMRNRKQGEVTSRTLFQAPDSATWEV